MKLLDRLFNPKLPCLPEMEERNRKIKALMSVVNKKHGVEEKMLIGLSHILGEGWFNIDEILTTPIQQALISDLSIIVIYNSLLPTNIRELPKVSGNTENEEEKR